VAPTKGAVEKSLFGSQHSATRSRSSSSSSSGARGYRSISAACAGAQQQTSRTSLLLLSIDGTDRRGNEIRAHLGRNWG